MTAGQTGQQPLLQLGLFPCPSNAISCGTGNNGNLQSQTIQIPSSPTTYLNLTQTYTYDHLNRLTNAQESGGGANWAQAYNYDAFGNRWISASSAPPLLPALTLETPVTQSWYSTTVPNRIAAWAYDNDGNVTQIANMARSFTYDGENNQVTATVGSGTSTYVYDGLGQRVSKTVAGQTTTYVYDAFGNLAAEYGGQSTGCGMCYVTTDHLGSTRLLTNSLGGIFARYDYEPFGQEIPANYDGRTTAMGYALTPDAGNPKFTGQMRDFETKDANDESFLDFFNVRYFSGAQGRFQSPDPGNAGADPSNPQSWNGYAYVNNNPLSYTDPSGMFVEDPYCADPVSCGIAAAVAVFDLGELLADIFGGGGPPPSIPSSLATPSSPIIGTADNVPTFSVTGWGTADPAGYDLATVGDLAPLDLGVIFFAQATAIAPKKGFNRQFLPANANVCTANNNQFYAPPTFNIRLIVAAGKAGGWSPRAASAAVGQYGKFDFQRTMDSAGNTTFYSGYTPVSNFGVGAYLYGAGFSESMASIIANSYALFKSSNLGDRAQTTYRNLGYETAAKGQVPQCRPK